ncbi:hypothetical protein HDV00_002551 [Rhizophlyctis rosea]|nr:hypothetical protein HDV00_002551 [Rhizophlyctis rosea]
MKGIPKVMATLLRGDDTVIPRIVLRTLKYLGIRDEPFQREMVKSGIISKIVPCLKSDDEETQCWALALLHDLLSNVEAHTAFMSANGLDLLIDMSNGTSVHLSLYIADIFVYLCNAGNKEALEDSDILDAVFHFCRSREPELRYAGTALLLNLATMSTKLIDGICSSGGIDTLSLTILDSDKESLQSVSAKTLATIVRKNATHTEAICDKALIPLCSCVCTWIDSVMDTALPESYQTRDETGQRVLTPIGKASPVYEGATAPSIHSLRRLSGFLESLQLLLQSKAFLSIPSSPSPTMPELELRVQLSEIVRSLIEVLAVPLEKFTRIRGRKRRAGRFGVEETEDEEEDVSDPETETDEEPEGEYREECGKVAVFAMKVLVEMESVVAASTPQLQRTVVEVVMQHSRGGNEDICQQAVATLALIHKLIPNDLLSTAWTLATNIHRREPAHPVERFYAQYLKEAIAQSPDNEDVPSLSSSSHHVRMSADDKTTNLTLSPQGWEVRNDSWTFESIRCSHAVQGAGKFAYEVILGSSGIIQVGWCLMECKFDPEAGTGVGDDVFSYAYDGSRMKKWHGVSPVDNDYGEEWSPSDTITALLDLDNGTISYMRNGVDLGVAFEGVSKSTRWFPAISLASDQGCRVRFGSGMDPLSYVPNGYVPMASLAGDVEKYDLIWNGSVAAEAIDPEGGEILQSESAFEVQMSLRGIDESCIPLFGVVTSEQRFVGLAFLRNGKAKVVQMSKDSLVSGTSSSLHNLLTAEGGSSSDEGVVVVSEVECGVRETDVFGCGIRESDGCVVVVRNGNVVGADAGGHDGEVYPALKDVARFVVISD